MLRPHFLSKFDKTTPKTYNYKNVPHKKNYSCLCYSHLFLLQYYSRKHSFCILSLYQFRLLSLCLLVVCMSSPSTWSHRHFLFIYQLPFNKNYNKNLSLNILVIRLKSLNHCRNACICRGYLNGVEIMMYFFKFYIFS